MISEVNYEKQKTGRTDRYDGLVYRNMQGGAETVDEKEGKAEVKFY